MAGQPRKQNLKDTSLRQVADQADTECVLLPYEQQGADR